MEKIWNEVPSHKQPQHEVVTGSGQGDGGTPEVMAPSREAVRLIHDDPSQLSPARSSCASVFCRCRTLHRTKVEVLPLVLRSP
jgi:hypothetical protein